MEKILKQRPKVSVIVEGYNQSRDLGSADDTIAALRRQEFDLSTVEVILAGSPEQVEGWERRFAGESQFHSLRPYSLAGAHYYRLKNAGAMAATGEILAFTDSDVIPSPRWLASLVEAIDNGAVATAGITQFRPSSGLEPDSIVMMMVASVTWGWVVGKSPEAARGFMDHNLGIRADAFREIQYETQYGRILASPLLFRALQKAGKSVRLVGQQRAGIILRFATG
jgi:glycosyltransferase involved in cell wall biosynthesis